MRSETMTLKLGNSGENFGLLRDGRRLAVEQRKKITGADTRFPGYVEHAKGENIVW